ncbi:MAG TPA: HD domain-containing phosphohydrolase [Solirubrobacteraceae bacterium]|jgi:PAS domain S-box-containing protein|nr:HD domain-containing phosphohydrolase [Solirubrobacteraceae bacterium]
METSVSNDQPSGVQAFAGEAGERSAPSEGGATGKPRARRKPSWRKRQAPSDFERALELASLLENASDAMIGVTVEGSITSWGRGAERLFGYTAPEARGQHISLLAPPARAHEPGAFLQRVLEGERVEQAETERLDKQGRTVKVQLTLAAIGDEQGRPAGAVGIYRDLTDQRVAESALRESERRYHSVVEALSEGVFMQERDGSIVAFNKSVERILGLTAEEISSGSPDFQSWSLIREDGSPVEVNEYPTVVTLRTGEAQMDVVLGVESPGLPTRWLSVNSRPLRDGEERRPYAAVASFSDITELRATLAELREARSEDLRRLALVSEYRDDDTNRHTERVGVACESMARALGLKEDLVWTIRRAAPLHDVGKIGIPDNILLKPSALTREEFEVMKTHTVIGGRILCHSRAPVLRMATAIAFTHHERWDGTGYPARMKRKEIPLVGRIVAVADAFDAMTHDRPYRRARPIEQALEELRRCSAGQFDPEVVAAFLGLDHSLLVDLR